ncbi:retinal pigment epithelial membrane family protein [Mycobacterium xenopi 3993]|nr:retinal pigment epithelial membrane family protein [Mycobacterium xenopi 3993]
MDLPVTGHIPEYLDGRYLRNGPNPVADVDPVTYHWFSGDGMVHGVAIRDGKAAGIATAGCAARPYARPSASRHRPARPACRHVVAGRQHERAHPRRAHPGARRRRVAIYELTDELDTVGSCDFDGTLAGGYTAHPHRDPATGELHAVSYSFARGNTSNTR